MNQFELIRYDQGWRFFHDVNFGPRIGQELCPERLGFEAIVRPLMTRGHVVSVSYRLHDRTISATEAYRIWDDPEDADGLFIRPVVKTQWDIVTISKFATMMAGKSVREKRGVPAKRFERPTRKKQQRKDAASAA